MMGNGFTNLNYAPAIISSSRDSNTLIVTSRIIIKVQNKMSAKQCRNKKNRSKSRSKSKSRLDEENSPKFEIKVSQTMGRYMVATADLKPGEIIINEQPIVVGPCTACKVQCIGCYKNLEKTEIFKCKKCSWPFCTPTCPGLNAQNGHTNLECTILAETHSAKFFHHSSPEEICLNLQAIVPLRCLLLKSSDPTSFDTIMNMENHNALRKKIPELWQSNQKNVVDRLIKDWGLTEFTELEIHTICGILEVNAFEIGQGVTIRGLYPTAFLMSHNCIPNTNHTDQKEDYRLTVRASTRILKEQPITLSYAYTLQNTLRRRESLLENKFFECRCTRCSDPTEMGTYSGAVICPKCTKGLVLSDEPLNPEASWSCTNSRKNCRGYSISAKSMQLLVNRIGEEVDKLDCNDVEGMESFLSKYRNVLHPTHYLCLGVKVALSQLYGKISNFLINELSVEDLARKRDICREILQVFDTIEPGYTRIRGVTLYELHAPLMILLTRKMGEKNFDKAVIKAELKEVIRCLVEAMVILSYEPVGSPEGGMGLAAKEALLQIKDWEKVVGKF